MINRRQGIFALLFLLAARLIGMASIPLNETTEARYGEIARKMLETGNWVTLLHDYNIPFLAKPPLSTWFSAAFMGVFGVNEFTARLPSLLLSLGVLGLVAFTVFVRSGREAALASTLVLAGSLGFFVAAGSVMTDPALVFCTTLIMLSFWHAMTRDSRLWGYLFFAGCGLGLLAKGPVALVLTGIPVFFWVLIRKQWKPLWQRLPWIGGSLLTLAIALPWYLLAEQRTPGFLNYFLIGENIGRFIDPSWKGDRYGFAHAYPRGMIWAFVLMGLFPWCLVALGWLARQRKKFTDGDGWLLFTGLWTVTTPLFFTFAANIIWTYCLMMIPGFVLLFTEIWVREKRPAAKFFPALAAVMGIIGMLAIAAFAGWPEKTANSQKDVIAAWQKTAPKAEDKLLFWSNRMEFAAAFYSGGRARTTQDPAQALSLLRNKTKDCIVAYTYNVNKLPPNVRTAFKETARLTNKRGVRLLLCEAS